MKQNKDKWPRQEEFNKAMEQAPEGFGRMTDEALDEMSEHYKEKKEK